jgi:ArsR family transcriptional regulator
VEAGLAERYQEGAWAMFRTVDQGKNGQFVKSLFEQLDLDDRALEKDRERLNAVKERRAQKAAEYFSQNASSWDELRSLHVADEKVEAAILNLLGSQPINDFLDLGTGTGRMLELLSKKYEHGIGVDISHEMMAIARANLEEAGIKHAQVRHGDVFHLPFSNDSYDLIIIHQVLHYLDNPAQVIKEAAKALTPQGRLLIVDFAPHELEFLRDEHAHLRLGFSDEQMEGWLNEAGLNANKSEHLKPDEDAAHPLIVSLWLAQDARTAS